MLTREQAANIARFAEACEYGFAYDPQGDIQYAVTVTIDSQRHGAAFVVPGEKVYSQDRVAEGITQLYQGLVEDGFIGHNPLTKRQGVTLTGDPLGDVIQLGAAIHNLPANQ